MGTMNAVSVEDQDYNNIVKAIFGVDPGPATKMEKALGRDLSRVGRLAGLYDVAELGAALDLIKENPCPETVFAVVQETADHLNQDFQVLLGMMFPSLAKAVEEAAEDESVFVRKTQRAMLYQEQTVISPRKSKDAPGTYAGVSYKKTGFRAPGALYSLLKILGYEDPGEYVQIEDIDVLHEEGQMEFFQALKEQGWITVHGNMAVRAESTMGLAIQKLLGDVQGWGAYAQTLVNAPIDPVNGSKIWLGRVFFADAEYGEDGSGRCSPDVVNGYVHQFRAIELELGLFAKGIVRPVDNMTAYRRGDEWFISEDGVPEDADEVQRDNLIVLAYNQVKGNAKPWAKAKSGSVACVENVGCAFIQTWMNHNTMSSCFQLLQHIPWCAESRDILTRLNIKGIKKIIKRGWAERLEDACASSPALGELVGIMQGLGVDPMKIPSIQQAAVSSLEAALYGLAQGGFRGDYHPIVMDNRVPRGTIVMNGRAGRKCVAWRFPMLHAAGMQILTTEDPSDYPEFFCAGKIPARLVFMNPDDVMLMQGDDDGDCIAISYDEDVVRLFEMARENARAFKIENPAKAKSWADTFALQNYIWGEKIPPLVGAATIMQAQLHAVKAKTFADLWAWIIQAAVDSPKKDSLLLSMKRIMEIKESEIFVEDGDHWVPNPKLWAVDAEGHIKTGQYDQKQVRNTFVAIMDRYGATYEDVGPNGPITKVQPVLQWRNPLGNDEEGRVGLYSRKGDDSDLFVPIQGRAAWMNTVHGCYNICARTWATSPMSLPATRDVRMVLGDAMKAKGLCGEWAGMFSADDIFDHPNMRQHMGRVRGLFKKSTLDEEKLDAETELFLTSMGNIPMEWWANAWYHCHIKDDNGRDRSRLISRLMTHELSPLKASVLGKECRASKIGDKAKTILLGIAGKGDTSERAEGLAAYIYSDTKHNEMLGVHMRDCPACKTARKAFVVRNWRNEHQKDTESVSALVTSLNKARRNDELQTEAQF